MLFFIKDNYRVVFLFLGLTTNFTQGGINSFTDNHRGHPAYGNGLLSKGLRKGYFGWMGFGGSVMQWHPELKIGFGYVPTYLHWYDLENMIGAKLQKMVVDCARTINVEKHKYEIK